VNFTKKCVATAALCMMSVVSFAETKIAVFNAQAAITGTAVAKAKVAKFEKSADFAATKAKYDGIVADLKALDASFQKDGVTWSTEKKEEAEKKSQGLRQELQFNVKKLQASQQEMLQQLNQEIGPKLQPAVKQIIDAEKLNIVLDSQSAMYFSPEYDITPKVIAILDKAK
jgi:outer membrane protein